jgi:hypothetical protein
MLVPPKNKPTKLAKTKKQKHQNNKTKNNNTVERDLRDHLLWMSPNVAYFDTCENRASKSCCKGSQCSLATIADVHTPLLFYC